jgi:hypothetical protein
MKKEVQIYILELLKLFKEKFATANRNPSLLIGEDGNLWLWLPIGEIFQSIIFDEDYEDITPQQSFDAIIKDLSKAGYDVGA